LTQLRQHERELEAEGVQVVIVTFDESSMARAYIEQTDLSWPLLLDTQRQLYRAYGMERASRWSIYGPASIWHYLKLIFQGRKIRRPGKDWLQVGGDVIVDDAGKIRYLYVSTSPHDRPEVDEMLSVIEPLNKN
jgi:peroxiredoxin